jgi:hypothetical protein
MLVKNPSQAPWVICKNCGSKFRMGKSCECGNVKTQEQKDGSFFIVGDSDDIIYDTE